MDDTATPPWGDADEMEWADQNPSEYAAWQRAATLENCRRAFVETGNPIYFWDAIQHCSHMSRLEINDSVFRASLPDWCLKHIQTLAFQILNLAQGLDETIQPEPDGDDPEGWGKSFDEWHRNPTLTFQDAVDRLPSRLGFTRPGWNAFADYKRALERFTREVFIAYDYKVHRAAGLSQAQAFDLISEDHGISDERNLRRIISRFRWARPGG